MSKKTVCVKMSDKLKEFLEYDAVIVYESERQLSRHIIKILENYRDTRK